MSDILKRLEAIRDKAKDKKKKKGSGQCLICNVFTDDADDFTCGHLHCKETLKEEMSARKDLLETLGADSIEEAAKEIARIKTVIDDIERKS